jgi:hypothetical protein
MPPRPILFHRIIRDAAALGMTGKAPGAPCKRCRAGSIPAFSTIGSEGDGTHLAWDQDTSGSTPGFPTMGL